MMNDDMYIYGDEIHDQPNYDEIMDIISDCLELR